MIWSIVSLKKVKVILLIFIKAIKFICRLKFVFQNRILGWSNKFISKIIIIKIEFDLNICIFKILLFTNGKKSFSLDFFFKTWSSFKILWVSNSLWIIYFKNTKPTNILFLFIDWVLNRKLIVPIPLPIVFPCQVIVHDLHVVLIHLIKLRVNRNWRFIFHSHLLSFLSLFLNVVYH